jgi:hypothetical protein
MGLLSFDDDPPARADRRPTAIILLSWRYFLPGLTYVPGALARRRDSLKVILEEWPRMMLE